MKIGFIGIGKLGKDVSEVISGKYETVGFDINSQIETDTKLVENLKDAVVDKDIIFCAVPTPHEKEYDGKNPTSHLVPKNFNYNILKECLKDVNKYSNKNSIIVVISTVLPGTTRSELKEIITEGHLIYNPYLIAQTTVKEDMVNPEMIIIGNENGEENENIKKLINFYENICSNNVRFEIGTWEEAESIKIFYNTFITAKLCLVNMIQDVAMKIGNINVDIVTDALKKSNKRIMGPQYMKAGLGDGGACHPRDNIALRWLANKYEFGYDIFSAIMLTREKQSENIAKFMIEKSNSDYFVILGTSFKPGAKDDSGSPSILVASYLFSRKKNVLLNNSIENIEKNLDEPHTYLLGHYGSYFKNYNFAKNSIIIDPWREFDKNIRNDLTVIHYGNSRN